MSGYDISSEIVKHVVPIQRVMGLAIQHRDRAGVQTFVCIQSRDQLIKRFEVHVIARLEGINDNWMDFSQRGGCGTFLRWWRSVFRVRQGSAFHRVWSV